LFLFLFVDLFSSPPFPCSHHPPSHPLPASTPAGGIAPKILPAMLDNSLFYANLVAKGRMKSLLSAIPVYIVTHPQVRA
jgi:hypothetical protein